MTDFATLIRLDDARPDLAQKMRLAGADHAHQHPNGGDVTICRPGSPVGRVAGTDCPPRPVCGFCGTGCENPQTVDPSAPCDAFGPVCLTVAYECGCDECSDR